MPRITDPEIKRLARYAARLHLKHKDRYKNWEGSPFSWILNMPSRTRGKIGEDLVSAYLEKKGFSVVCSPDSEADLIINGKRVEIKLSTLWKSGVYKFQQLRDQNYKFVVCLGLSPFDVHCWVIPKDVIMDKWKKGIIRSQHGGRAGRDTAWIQTDPEGNSCEWIKDYGGSLLSAVSLIAELTGQEPL